MGYKIRDIAEMRNRMNPQWASQPCFYCLFLYNSNHIEFADYVEKEFNNLYEMAGHTVHFFMFKREKPYSNYDMQIEQACEMFGIHPKKLPAIILFPDLSSSKCNAFFIERDINDTLREFFRELFMGRYLERYVHADFVRLNNTQMVIDASKHLRKILRNINNQICYLGESDMGISIAHIEELIIQQEELIRQQHKEVMGGLVKIESLLKEIHEEFVPFKTRLQYKMKELLELPDSELKEEEIEELHSYMDEGFYHFTERISKEGNEIVSIAKYPFLASFEQKSKDMIKSCIITEALINKSEYTHFDYTLCASGYWKAIEIEMNIVIVDALRKLKRLIDSIPNTGKSNQEGAIGIFAGNKSNGKPRIVNINYHKNEKLSTCMFGQMFNISRHYNENEYDDVLKILYEENEYYNDVNEFIRNFVEDIEIIVNTYRNDYSHTEMLSKQELEDLKKRIFDAQGAYYKISILKDNISKL